MQFASRLSSSSSILSPLAQPYRASGSVAAYLQEQAHSSTTTEAPSATEYSQKDMQRLESMLQQLENVSVNNDDDENMISQQPSSAVESLLHDLELSGTPSMQIGPIAPPTPALSTRPAQTEDPVVRVTTHVWDTMDRDMEALKDENRTLKIKVARLEKQKILPQVDNYKSEMETQIGKLKYQNETDKTQKATMARALSEKDSQIKQLQIELDGLNERLQMLISLSKDYADVAPDRDHLRTTFQQNGFSSSRLLSDLTNIKDQGIQTLSQRIDELREVLKKAGKQDDELKMLAQERLDQLRQREKYLQAAKDKLTVEQIKVGELEDRNEDLQRKLNQVGDLQSQLVEKTKTCDRLRTKLRDQERVVEDATRRLNRAANESQALRGAAHLVKPEKDSKLSSLVMGCSECYAKNISCDNKARCRHCAENNETCARWRCSLRHILGHCPNERCTFPHDAYGWLLAPEPRPQW